MDQETLVKWYGRCIKSGSSVAQSRRDIREVWPPVTESELDRIQGIFEDRAGVIRHLRVPAVAADPDSVPVPWYHGPQTGDVFWPPLRDILKASLPAAAVDSINDASSKVVSYLAAPGSDSIQTRGLVLGYVQSGKTTNFAAVAAKAADAGYRVIIVLSGMHNSLRRQTQVRMQEYLHEPNRRSWHILSDLNEDFINPGEMNVNKLLADPDTRNLVVIKKNAARLNGFLDWLESADQRVLEKLPMLVIDDEADQASIDTSPKEDEEKRSAINRLIIRLLDNKKCAYVGYTATPFANLFVDPAVPEQLYPRDFIVDLPRPAGYFGPERVFGRERLRQDAEEWESDGLDLIRIVPDEETAELQPPRGKEGREAFHPSMTASLRTALRYFVMASAARRARGLDKPGHSTMLVHTTLYSAIQDRTRDPIERELATLRKGVNFGPSELLGELEELWVKESGRLPTSTINALLSEDGFPTLEPVSFAQLSPFLSEVLQVAEVKVDNYLSEDRIDYSGSGRVLIAIGGNTLSRGLTLEGLVVSLFVRAASAYDTLLQMGRWFGYRRGYEDLPRIWMTRELRDQFQDLATVESEIRLDIERYEKEGIKPLDFPVRIRTHPKLAITSQLKMQAARRAHVSYSGRRIQTILFEHRNSDWLEGNFNAAKSLIGSGDFKRRGGGNLVALDLPADLVIDFLTKYRFHENSVDQKSELISAYISSQRAYGELDRWNVAVMSQARDVVGQINLGTKEKVNLITRTRTNEDSYANIKTLMSRPDTVVDIDVDQAISDAGWSTQVSYRPEGVGLLMLYPIAKDSSPGPGRAGRQHRYNLDAVAHVIGVGLAFPKAARSETEQEYMTAAIEGDIEEFHPSIQEA